MRGAQDLDMVKPESCKVLPLLEGEALLLLLERCR